MEGGEVFSGYSKTSAESYITHVHLVRGMRKSIFPSSEKKVTECRVGLVKWSMGKFVLDSVQDRERKSQFNQGETTVQMEE